MKGLRGLLLALLTAAPAAAQELDATKIYLAGCILQSGSGSPEGVVTAACGHYWRTDTRTVYRKTTTTGNTGWLAEPALDQANTFTANQTITGNLSTSGTVYANTGGAANGIVTMGPLPGATQYGGIWVGQPSPNSGNYAFLATAGAPGQTLFNAQSATGDIEFRVQNNARMAVGGAGAIINGTTNIIPTMPFQVRNQGKTLDLLTIADNGDAAHTGNLSATGWFKAVAGSASSEVYLGTAGGLGGIWFGQASPTTANYTILATSTGLGTTYINAPNSNSDIEFRFSNATHFIVGYNGIGINTPAGTIPAMPLEIRDNTQATQLFTIANTGAAVHSSSLAVTGNFAVATTKFTVAAATGNVDTQGYIGSSNFASQTTGWRCTFLGQCDARYLFADELRAKLFSADLEQVLRGSALVTKSFGVLSQAFTCPAASGTATLWVADAPETANLRVFAVNDWIVIRSYSRTDGDGDGNLDLTIGDCVGYVNAYADGSGATEGQQSWTFNRGAAGSSGTITGGTVIAVNNLAIDFGISGNGVTEQSAVDGAEGVNAPYFQVKTWSGTAPVAVNFTPRARLGNLLGITAAAEYGLIAGNFSTTNGAFFRASDQNFDLHGITAKWWSGAANVITIAPNGTSPFLGLGNPAPTSCCTTAGAYLGWNSTASRPQFALYANTTNYLQWDGSKLQVQAANFILDASGNITASSATLSGAITATSGTITGPFTIGTSGSFASGATGYTTGTGIWMDYNGGAPRFSVGNPAGSHLAWDGSNVLITASGMTISSFYGAMYAGATTYSSGTGWWLDYNGGAPRFRVGDPLGNNLTWDSLNLSLASANLTINSSGITLAPSTLYSDSRAYRFTVPTGALGVYAWRDTGATNRRQIAVIADPAASGEDASADLRAVTSAGGASYVSAYTTSTLSYLTARAATSIDIATVGSANPTMLQMHDLTDSLQPGRVYMQAPGDFWVKGAITHEGAFKQTDASVIYPGSLSGLTNPQSTYYLAAHASFAGLYTNGGMRIDGNLNLGGAVISSQFDVNVASNTVVGLRVADSGKVSLGAITPTSISGDYVLAVRNASSSGYGLFLVGGADASHEALRVMNYSQSVDLLRVFGDGSIVVGAPSGGAKGAGTINASAVYDDNVLLTDALLEAYYGAAVRDATWGAGTRRLYTLAETADVTRTEFRLPWMPTRDTFEQERTVGGMITRLWQGQEQQQLYILELEARLAALEAAMKGK